MKKIILLSALCLGTYLLPSCNNAENSTNKEAKEENKEKFEDTDVKRDADFAAKAASGGMMEVELGKIALTNGMAKSVKDFGQGMITDHSAANDELKSAAAAKNISLPAAPDADMQKKIDELRQKKGAEFDKDYIDMMVKDHKDDIDLFQKEADKGNDPELKAWAAAKLPTLQHHLHMCEEIQEQIKKNK